MFDATFDSLHTYQVPEWFRNAKLGIWSHWGPQSVPMFGDWYARNMYIQGTNQYEYHIRHYGHPSKFGYKDICNLWKAENFDPDALVDLYVKAGARYLMTQGTHHDHFFNYASDINRMNSANVGPHKDILRLWKDAADKRGLRFGISEHLGASGRHLEGRAGLTGRLVRERVHRVGTTCPGKEMRGRTALSRTTKDCPRAAKSGGGVPRR